MEKKQSRLTTERLVLKALEERDRQPFLRMAADARVTKTYMMPDLADADRAYAFFSRMRALSLSDARFVYGIFLDNALIGFLNDCGLDDAQTELGYFIAPECWNRGYATEALRAAVGELFRMGCAFVTAGYFEDNTASCRVMEKCGMLPLERESRVDYRGTSHRCLYCGVRRPREAEKNNGPE